MLPRRLLGLGRHRGLGGRPNGALRLSGRYVDEKGRENGPGRGSCLYKGIVDRRIEIPARSPTLWVHSCSWKSLLGESYRAG